MISTNRGRLTETPSGMIAYREFTREGFDVHMFERDNTPGKRFQWDALIEYFSYLVP